MLLQLSLHTVVHFEAVPLVCILQCCSGVGVWNGVFYNSLVPNRVTSRRRVLEVGECCLTNVCVDWGVQEKAHHGARVFYLNGFCTKRRLCICNSDSQIVTVGATPHQTEVGMSDILDVRWASCSSALDFIIGVVGVRRGE
ncbi:unnamed protein product, partial [Scytosiphon promiscuus]